MRDYAGALGKTELALKAARTAFESSCSLEDFRAAETWAGKHSGKHWGKVRKSLLAHLARASHAPDRIEIYLVEGLIDEAIRSVGDDRGSRPYDDVLMRLAEAAHGSHPDWVIGFAERMAASIMDANQAGSYPLAAKWLEKAVLAYEAAGREHDWARCIEMLIDKHRRKY